MAAEIGQGESRSAELKSEPESARIWHAELKTAAKREDVWRRRAMKVIDRYRDERDMEGGHKVNILWANTETLKSALFAHTGKPDVRRKYPGAGQKNRIARTVATVIERALSVCGEMYDIDEEFEAAIEDHLLPGRGQVWLEFETGDGYQKAELVHVQWDEFRFGYAKRWRDVPWVARRHGYTRDDLKRYFPAEHAGKIPLNLKPIDEEERGGEEEKKELFRRAAVWELWDKATKRRIYVAEGYEWIIRADEDPYGLEGFFPCPRPLYAVRTTDSLIPIPEYTLYQDQAQELDRLTARINRLVEACKRRGVYAAEDDSDGALSALADAADNQFIPTRNWASLLDKGGLASVFMAEDIRPYAAVLRELYAQRDQVIQAIYEITGISDIIRGATNAGETATAQQLKANYGSQRMQKRQAEVQNFVRNAYKIKAELIAEHFSRDTLAAMTGIEMPDRMQVEGAQRLMQSIQGLEGVPGEVMSEARRIAEATAWEDIEQIIRSDDRRHYAVNIETDSTVFADAESDKQQRMEFVTAVTELMMAVLPASQANPQILPFARELVMFMVGGFKVGRGLEETIEDMFEDMASQAANSDGQASGDPRAEAEAAAAQQKMEIEGAKAQADMQMAAQKHQADMAKAAQGMQIDKAKGMAAIAKAMQPRQVAGGAR